MYWTLCHNVRIFTLSPQGRSKLASSALPAGYLVTETLLLRKMPNRLLHDPTTLIKHSAFV